MISPFPIFKIFWKITEKSDNANLKKQIDPDNILRTYDINYANDDNTYHNLDFYRPDKITEKLPCIIDIHGGGWMYGTKRLNQNYCLHLANNGFTVFNINYRLCPEVTMKEQLQDILIALKFIGENKEKFKISDNFILAGDSAGGQLAVFAYSICKSDKLKKAFECIKNNLHIKGLLLTSPAPFMNENGPVGMYTKPMLGKNYKADKAYYFMDFNNFVDEISFPPTALITSSGDMLARNQTKRLHKLLINQNTDVYLQDFGGFSGLFLPHVFSVLNPSGKVSKSAIKNACDFLKSKM